MPSTSGAAKGESTNPVPPATAPKPPTRRTSPFYPSISFLFFTLSHANSVQIKSPHSLAFRIPAILSAPQYRRKEARGLWGFLPGSENGHFKWSLRLGAKREGA